jgi:hypothetical protein
MPNWVYNTMTVNGSLPALQHFQKAITKPPMRKAGESWEPVPLAPNEFSYWGIKSPEDIGAFLADGRDWTIDNWGCRGDAYEAVFEITTMGLRSIMELSWQSPWSAPIEWVTHCAKDYPELEFSFFYQEEQGWGGSMEFYKGELNDFTEYDVPNNHAEYDDRGMECNCIWNSDTEFWFDDCPRELSE